MNFCIVKDPVILLINAHALFNVLLIILEAWQVALEIASPKVKLSRLCIIKAYHTELITGGDPTSQELECNRWVDRLSDSLKILASV